MYKIEFLTWFSEIFAKLYLNETTAVVTKSDFAFLPRTVSVASGKLVLCALVNVHLYFPLSAVFKFFIVSLLLCAENTYLAVLESWRLSFFHIIVGIGLQRKFTPYHPKRHRHHLSIGWRVKFSLKCGQLFCLSSCSQNLIQSM